MSFHGHLRSAANIRCERGGAIAGMTRHVFFCLFETVMVPSRDLVPYANSILCILVSLISHRPDRNARAIFNAAVLANERTYRCSIIFLRP